MGILKKKITAIDFELLMDLIGINGMPEGHRIDYEPNGSNVSGFLTIEADAEIRQDILDFVVSCREHDGISEIAED